MKEYTRFVEKYLTRREKFVQPSEGYIYIFFDQSIWPVRPYERRDLRNYIRQKVEIKHTGSKGIDAGQVCCVFKCCHNPF